MSILIKTLILQAVQGLLDKTIERFVYTLCYLILKCLESVTQLETGPNCHWFSNPAPCLESVTQLETGPKPQVSNPAQIQFSGTLYFSSKGSKWFHRRKLLTPTFHFSILNNFRVVFNEKADILARKLSTMADGRAFNIFPIITQCSLDIICGKYSL